MSGRALGGSVADVSTKQQLLSHHSPLGLSVRKDYVIPTPPFDKADHLSSIHLTPPGFTILQSVNLFLLLFAPGPVNLPLS